MARDDFGQYAASRPPVGHMMAFLISCARDRQPTVRHRGIRLAAGSAGLMAVQLRTEAEVYPLALAFVRVDTFR